MKSSMKRKTVLAVLLVSLLFSSFLTVQTSAKVQETVGVTNEELPKDSYIYWEEYSNQTKTPAFSRPMYRANKVILSSNIGTEPFVDIKDICSDEENNLYILDSGASKVYILNPDYTLKKTVEAILLDGEAVNIPGASGIFAKDHLIYIADTKNARVLAMDDNGKVIHNLTLPESRLIPTDFNYSPIKIAIDSKDYMYIASDGSFYGALVYSPNMEFLGFFGANTVALSATDVIGNFIKGLFSNDEKKAASALSLPFQFNDFVVGPKDFVYTVTGEKDVATGQVKKLNPGGKDVLGKQEYNFADQSDTLVKPQILSAIDVDRDGFFYVLDTTYGRVYWYDDEGNLISIFGSIGSDSQIGTFAFPTSLAVNGTDVLVSDSQGKSITAFSLTEYGALVREAQLKTLRDDFEEAIEDWKEVLRQDANSQLAYRGLAKAYYTKGDYEEALSYAKMGTDRETYAAAFVKLRTKFLEKWFTVIFLGAAIMIAALWWLIHYKRKHKIVWIKNKKIKVMLSCAAHPFESFRLVKEKGEGSLIIATVILAVFYLVTALKDMAAGFAFNRFDPSNYNSFYIFLSTVGLVALFVIANWLVCVLMGGIGKIKEIYTVTCYSLIPVIFGTLTGLLFTHLLSPEEYIFITILQVICVFYTFFMLAVGIMKVHDYEFGKFAGTTVVTAIAMAIIVFLIFLILLLGQQMFGWIKTAYLELKYR